MLRTIGAGGSLQKDIWSTVPGGGTPVFFGGKKAMRLQTKWKEEQQSTGTLAVTLVPNGLCVQASFVTSPLCGSGLLARHVWAAGTLETAITNTDAGI